MAGRGDDTLPPPLVGATIPAVAALRAPKGRQETPDVTTAGLVAAPPIDGLSRLNAALWFTDTFHAAEVERIRRVNEAADAEFAAQSSSSGEASPKKRKPPVRAPIPPIARKAASTG